MGQPKMLLPWKETTVIGHLINQWKLAGAALVVAVINPADVVMAAELDRLDLPSHCRVPNQVPERGMFSSIQSAASWDGWSGALSHWIIILGDQPHLRPSTVHSLLAFAEKHPNKICQPSFRGKPKHPVVLPRGDFFALRDTAEATLRNFLQKRGPLAFYELDDPGLTLDLDFPEDYRQAVRLYS